MRPSTGLITGGSKGLGRALALELARRGVQVVLVARHEGPLSEVVDQIRAEGGRAHGIVADLGDPPSATAIAGEAAALVGNVDLLVHNASTLGPVPMPLLLDTEAEDFERVLAVNLVGPFRLTRRIAGAMALRSGGTVLLVSSDAATHAYPNWGAYGVSKAALDHLGRIWAAEMDGTGVRFLSVDPGEMNTQMHADAVPDADLTTLASPADVARKIVDAVLSEPAVASGDRMEVTS